MSWQEELRKLDEELAAGRLSADDYRVRRDQVLSSAVAPGGQSPAPPPAVEATTIMPTIGDDPNSADKTQIVSGGTADRTQAVNQGPAQHGGDSDSDKTQIVPGQAASGAERTQAVQGGWQAARPTDMERTQAVPAVPGVPPQNQAGPLRPPPGQMPHGQMSPPSGFPQQPPPQQQNWNQPPQDDAPLWGGDQFPPLASSGSPDWVKQGPEVFSESGKGGNTGKIVAIVVAVIVLAGAAFGAYWLWGRGGNDNAQNPPATQGTSAPGTSAVPTSQAPPDPQPVGKIAPTVKEDTGVSDFTTIPSRNFLTNPELKAYQNHKAGMTKLALGDLGNGQQAVVLIVEFPNAKSAKAARDALTHIELANGMRHASGMPSGVQVEQVPPRDGKIGRYRAHYLSGNMVVRVDVAGTDQNTMLTQFNTALAAQLQVMPVDG